MSVIEKLEHQGWSLVHIYETEVYIKDFTFKNGKPCTVSVTATRIALYPGSRNFSCYISEHLEKYLRTKDIQEIKKAQKIILSVKHPNWKVIEFERIKKNRLGRETSTM